MPTASGTTQETIASVGWNSAPPQAMDQTTQETYGQSTNEVYEPQYGGGYGGGEEQQYYYEEGGEQYYEQ